MVRMRRVGQGIHDVLVTRHTSGVFQRAAPGAVDQADRRTVFVYEPVGNQFEPVKPAVSEVVFVERLARPQCEQLIQSAVLLRPVARFFTLLPWKPLRDFREFAVDRPQRRERVACYKPVQVRVLPAKCCLQDLVYLT